MNEVKRRAAEAKIDAAIELLREAIPVLRDEFGNLPCIVYNRICACLDDVPDTQREGKS